QGGKNRNATIGLPISLAETRNSRFGWQAGTALPAPPRPESPMPSSQQNPEHGNNGCKQGGQADQYLPGKGRRRRLHRELLVQVISQQTGITAVGFVDGIEGIT